MRNDDTGTSEPRDYLQEMCNEWCIALKKAGDMIDKGLHERCDSITEAFKRMEQIVKAKDGNNDN